MNTLLERVKTQFKDPALFEQALTHRSWVNENKGLRPSNERLEFLGDAVLEFVVSENLYKTFLDKEEGYLTALRANLVNTVNLAKLAETLEIGDSLYLSRGETEGGGRKNPSLLADTVEAIIGALFIDQGLSASSAFIHEHILVDAEAKSKEPLKDSKSRLQEFVQSKGSSAPRYSIVSQEGPDHAKFFTVRVEVDGEELSQGSGRSKSDAEQNAALHGLEKLTN
jgi:ribonuclease-3